MSQKIDAELIEDIRTCMDKKNPEQCINKKLEEHGIEPEQKEKIMKKVMKSMEEEKHGKK